MNIKDYLKEYKWEHIRAMKANGKKQPLECPEQAKGKLVVITGATSGIGYQTARLYAARGAHLLCINRNEEKSKALCDEMRHEFGTECQYLLADFCYLADVHRVAQELLKLKEPIDVLIHNAGVYLTKKIFTDDDIEMVFQINFLSSFIINYRLQDKFKEQGSGRILFVNSEGHRFAWLGIHLDDLHWKKHHYSGLKGYGSAKVAQLLSMLKFAEEFEGTGVTINAVHPGNVKTGMGENNGWLYRTWKKIFINPSSASPEISAKSLYYLGMSPDVANISGKFFNLTTEEVPSPPALDRERAEELWDLSIEMGGLA